jgi:hypothetical protein
VGLASNALVSSAGCLTAKGIVRVGERPLVNGATSVAVVALVDDA